MAAARRFTILDATALLSATAFSALLAHWALAPLARRLEGYARDIRWEAAYLDSLLHYAAADRALGRALLNGLPPAAMAFLFSYTFILLALRLLPPRPPAAESARLPGLWACAAAVLGATLMIALGYYQPVVLTASVALAWLGLALSGRWRSERSWIDRLGRAVGAFWVAMLPLCAYFAWVEWVTL